MTAATVNGNGFEDRLKNALTRSTEQPVPIPIEAKTWNNRRLVVVRRRRIVDVVAAHSDHSRKLDQFQNARFLFGWKSRRAKQQGDKVLLK